HLDGRELAERIARRLGLAVVDAHGGAAVVARAQAGSVAERPGIRPGDAILQVGPRDVPTVHDFQAALAALPLDRHAVLLVEGGVHDVYKKQGVTEIITLQKNGDLAKTYQVRQVILVLEKSQGGAK